MRLPGNFFRDFRQGTRNQSIGLLPSDMRLKRFLNTFNLEVGLVIAAFALIVGLILLAAAINQWRLADFGR